MEFSGDGELFGSGIRASARGIDTGDLKPKARGFDEFSASILARQQRFRQEMARVFVALSRATPDERVRGYITCPGLQYFLLTIETAVVILDWFREFIQACCVLRLCGVVRMSSGRAIEKQVSGRE